MAGRKRAATSKKNTGSSPPKLKKTASQVAFESAVDTLKTAAATTSQSKKTRAIDKQCGLANHPMASVFEDYDCMLNQTNIGRNNNKFYVIQLIKVNDKYYVYNRWGRVGEKGQDAQFGPFTNQDQAIKVFTKKFGDKTLNDWKSRACFVPRKGKYTMLDMAGEEEASGPSTLVGVPVRASGAQTKQQSRLDKETQDLVSLIFDSDMFNDQLKHFKIDTKKMPLGKLSKPQIAKGFDCLEEIENEIKKGGSGSKLCELSSKFYTLIPHDFGRTVPPVIKTSEAVRAKMDMLLVLGDIEVAQQLQKSEKGVKHELDEKYELLDCELTRVPHDDAEFQALKKYTEATHGRGKLLNIWKVNRKSEASRFDVHKNEKNRKLLWHGTNVAVVAAILKSGLRIMPHSGGRLGRGIYFASEQAKSACYVHPSRKGQAIMFLNEVVLGKEASNTTGDSTIVKPPPGYNSVVGRGQQEPDPKNDSKLKIDGKEVILPQARPVKQQQWSNSSFWQSEYLIYNENQCRIRYLLEFSFK